MTQTAAVVFLMLSAAGTASMAADADVEDGACRAVIDALRALGAADHYQWSMSATSPGRKRPLERVQVVIGDVVYMTPDQGRWVKSLITRNERIERVEDELSLHPLSGCHRLDVEGSPDLTEYEYEQDGGASQKRIWIEAGDGRPRRFESIEGDATIKMHVEYDAIRSPLPDIAPGVAN